MEEMKYMTFDNQSSKCLPLFAVGILFLALVPLQTTEAQAVAPSCPAGGLGVKTVLITPASNPGDFEGPHADAAWSCVRIISNSNALGEVDQDLYYDYYDRDGTKRKDTARVVGNIGAVTEKDKNGEVILSCKNLSDWIGVTCFGRMISVALGTALITLAAWLLAAAGFLFNTLVDSTIISFGTLFTPKVAEAVALAWSAFRDVANIIIIAMFVFIAINMILGVKEFGEKKKVAQVLIIAVLLNFSLLFTRVIVDASNFTAMQFYNASKYSFGVETTNNIGLTNEFSRKGISGQFIDLMGLTSLAETSNALSSAAFGSKTNNYRAANGWIALLFGLFAATLLFAAAAVLLYGCLLLVTRAVLLILLMLTSAMAFASWLIPHQFVEQGFVTWWKSLLKTAFFAPILMIFLWATLLVAKQLKPIKGALGELAADPTAQLDMNVLFSYLIIIGLLFASFKAANKFSGSIAGFTATQSGLLTGARIAAGMGLTYAAYQARGLGVMGRYTIGAMGGGAYKGMRAAGYGVPHLIGPDGNPVTDKYGNPVKNPDSTKFSRGAMRTARWIGRRTFDPMAIKSVRKGVEGLGGIVLGGDKFGEHGYLGGRERAARQLEEYARQMQPLKADRDRMAEDAAKAKGLEIDAQRAAHESQLAAAKAAKRAAEEPAEQAATEAEEGHASGRRTTREKIRADHGEADDRVKNSESELEAVRKQFAQDIASAVSQHGRGSAQTARLEEMRDAEIGAIRERLTTEKATLAVHEDTVRAMKKAGELAQKAVMDPHEENVKRREAALKDIVNKRPSRIDATRKAAQATMSVGSIGTAIGQVKWTPYKKGILDELAKAVDQHEKDEAVASFARAARANQRTAAAPSATPAVPTTTTPGNH